MSTTTAESGTSPYEPIARTGYAARGIVYVLVGVLALLAAFGSGDVPDGSSGALMTLLDQPLGAVMLGAIGVGLLLFAVWRTVQAVGDADNHGTDARGLVVRAGLLGSAVTYGLLGAFALTVVFGGNSGDGSGSSMSQQAARFLIGQPFGQILLTLAGLAVIGVGLAHLGKGWTAGFEKHMRIPEKRGWAKNACQFGLIARGVVFLIIGAYLGLAAWLADPDQARGLQGALQWVQSQAYGGILLAVIALGLFAFGLYSLLEARYRVIREPD